MNRVKVLSLFFLINISFCYGQSSIRSDADIRLNKTVSIDSLENGEKYLIHVASSGCFHNTEMWLTISRKNDNYYAKFKIKGTIERKKVKNSLKSSLLNDSKIDSIRRFETELVQVSSKKHHCTTVDTYTLMIDKNKAVYVNDNCDWKMNIGRMTGILFKKEK